MGQYHSIWNFLYSVQLKIMGNLNCLGAIPPPEHTSTEQQEPSRIGLQTLMGRKIEETSPTKASSSKDKKGKKSTSDKSVDNGKPKNIEDLEESVHIIGGSSPVKSLTDLVDNIEESVTDSPWAQAFLSHLKRKDEEHSSLPCSCRPTCSPTELSYLFKFCLLVANLRRNTKSTNSQKIRQFLQKIRLFFFEEREFKPAVNFRTFEVSAEKEEEIIRLYNSDLSDEKVQQELKKFMCDLRKEDRNIDEKLDDEFDNFIKNYEDDHPKNIFQRCLSRMTPPSTP